MEIALQEWRFGEREKDFRIWGVGQCDELREEGRGGEGASRETHGNVECFVIFGGPWAAGVTRDDQGASRLLCCCFSSSVTSDSCGHVDCSPPGSSVHGILQARILEWVAISFSRESSWPRDWTCISCIDRQVLPLSHQGIGASYWGWKVSGDVPHVCPIDASVQSQVSLSCPGASRGSDRRALREKGDRCLTGCTALRLCFLSQAQ